MSFFLLKNCSVYLFRAALYKLLFVLNKDVLFHYGLRLYTMLFRWHLTVDGGQVVLAQPLDDVGLTGRRVVRSFHGNKLTDAWN